MKIVFQLLIAVVLFCYASGIHINFRPFKVSFGDITYGIGLLLMILAIICFQLSAFRKGSLHGYKEALHDVKVEFENERHMPEK